MPKDDLRRANELTRRLQELARENQPKRGEVRGGDVIATDQLAAFGELLVVLARHLDDAQQTVKRLTVVIAGLTAVLAADVIWRLWTHG
jgi:hypothetical protein